MCVNIHMCDYHRAGGEHNNNSDYFFPTIISSTKTKQSFSLFPAVFSMENFVLKIYFWFYMATAIFTI